MPPIKKPAPKTVAKKDNTNVARKRVSPELVGDKPNYGFINDMGVKNPTKKDSTDYSHGFRYQIGSDKKNRESWGKIFGSQSFQNGATEAQVRRSIGNLNNKALVRDSSIPLAPTQFPD